MQSLMLSLVLNFALADAPRAVTLLTADAPAAGTAPATELTSTGQPNAEAQRLTPPDAPALPEAASTQPSAEQVGQNRKGALVKDVEPARLVSGMVAGLVTAGVVPAAITVLNLLLVAITSSGGQRSYLTDFSSPVALVQWAVLPLATALIGGPLAAGIAMGAGPVAGRVVAYSLLGLLAGALAGAAAIVVPPLGVLTLLGPTLGALVAVATSPAEAFRETTQSRLGATSPGPLFSHAF